MNEPKIVLTLILIITIAKHCEPASIDCTLNIGKFSSSNCEEGSWNGFLNNNTCCGGPFNGYLYALAIHANQTGQIFLNPTDQLNCLLEIKNSTLTNVFGCGIEKLTSGGGGCSDYTVNDVTHVLGDHLKSLTKSCEFQMGYLNKSCGSCVNDWIKMKGLLTKNDAESADIESDICRFAVLVSLASTRIDDQIWVQNTFQCLSQQHGVNVDEEEKGKNKSKTKAEVFVLVGGIVGVTIVVSISIATLMRRWYTSNPPLKKNALSRSLPKESDDLKVPIKEVYSATNDLNEMNFIGEGTAGKVYKGKLSNGKDVAVKHIINDGFVDTFLREVRSLSHVRHPNLVALLGYSENGEECFLIYELCTNGNLSEWLFGKEKALSWIQRLHVAIDSARGLWFLHTYPQGCIVHRDIKPTNILLGKNFEAKLSDFGLSKVIDLGETYASSEVRGTFGYMDPEYQNNRQVKSAGDVYSYGIVLLQILSGRRVINMNMRKPMPIDKMAKSLTRDSSIIGFADPKLEGEYSEAAFELVFKLALSCISLEQQRPSMEQVVLKLDDAIEISTSARASTPHSTP